VKYFRLNLMPRLNPDYCFLRDYPKALGLDTYKFGKGEEFGSDYPPDTRVDMSEREPGMKLPSLIGNTCNMLIVHREVKDVIAEVNEGPTEYLPLRIYNHKKRLASDEYFIVNPLGAQDCLDLSASKIEYMGKKIVAVKSIVLDRKKLEKAPDLFRVREDTTVYVASQRLLKRIMMGERTMTNITADVLPVAGE
jgi:hypothetical protein